MGVQNNKNAKEDKTMNTAVKTKTITKTSTVTEIDVATFNAFLQQNKNKIYAAAPKNPPITKNDEWRHEQV